MSIVKLEKRTPCIAMIANLKDKHQNCLDEGKLLRTIKIIVIASRLIITKISMNHFFHVLYSS